MQKPASDDTLLQQARNGDFEAFAALTEPHRQPVCEFLSGLVDAHTAEDVFMKATLKAWRSIGGFTGRSSYRTWLFSIARYAALDELRKGKARNELSTDDEASSPALSQMEDPTAPQPARNLEREETAEQVQKAIRELPETHRSVVLLFYYQNFQYGEIAEALGISIGTVMSRLHHAKKKLEKALSPFQQDLM